MPTRGAAVTRVLSRPPDIPRSPISELVKACKALPDFSTLQITYLTLPDHLPCWCKWRGLGVTGSCTEAWDRMLREEVDGVRDLAVACLRVVRMGRQQGEGRKQPALSERVNRAKEWAANRFKKSKTGCHEGEGIMLRVIELCSASVLRDPSPVPSRGFI